MTAGGRHGDGGRPFTPHRHLASLGLATYAWNAADDAFAWGPGIEGPLGPGAAFLATGAALRHACGGAPLLPNGQDRGTGVPYRLHRVLRGPDGQVRSVEDAGRWFAGPDGTPAFARGTLRRMREAPMSASGVLARAIRGEVMVAVAAGRPLALLLAVPDGDAGGDALVSTVRRILRGRDRFERCADGNLAVLLDACGLEQAEAAARRLAEAVADAGLRVRIGGACVPRDALDAATLVRLAEEAAETAREGRPFLHAPEPLRVRPMVGRSPDLTLLDALNGRRVTLLGEPMVEAGCEAPTLLAARAGLVTEDGALRSFAPGLGADLALLLDGRALELAAAHLAAAPEARFCLPIASATLAATEWLPTLAGHLGARRGVAGRLVLAVEEAAVAADLAAAHAALGTMKALGLGIALDGYGSGHLDPAQLAALPLDLLRMEGALVENATRSPDDRLHLRGLVALGYHLGLPVAAPWVEEAETVRMLTTLGCDLLHGSACGAVGVLAPERDVRRARATTAA